MAELELIHDHEHFSGIDSSSERIRDEIDGAINELETVYLRPGEPRASIETRTGIASVQIAVGYLWGAIAEREKDSTAVGHAVMLNHAWTAISYLQAGITTFLVGCQDPSETVIRGY